jgi:hypothetical protein
MEPVELVPLSVLALDLVLPTTGWNVYLADRDIKVVTDHIGREAIDSADARQLLDERREAEARKREVVERNEQRAIESDWQWRSQLNRGIPASMIPDGVAPAAAMLQAAHDDRPRRQSVLQHALTNSGGADLPQPVGWG